MEISKQSCLIYRLKGWRAEAIALTEVIPAIHHSGTASRPEVFLKTFYIIDLQDVWVNLGRGGREQSAGVLLQRDVSAVNPSQPGSASASAPVSDSHPANHPITAGAAPAVSFYIQQEESCTCEKTPN